MKEESNTLSAPPYSFARCLNAQCSKAESCLRRLAALQDTTQHPYITIVNPACVPADDNACPHFQTAEKFRAAWGVKRLLDKVPYADAVSIRKQLIGHFGKTKYYRFHREEYYLTPTDQAFIRQLFRNKGITEEPPFDRYTEEYKW